MRRIAILVCALCTISTSLEASMRRGAAEIYHTLNRQVRVVFPAKAAKSDDHLHVALDQLRKQDMQYRYAERALSEQSSPHRAYSNSHVERGRDFIDALEGKEDVIWGFAGGAGSLDVVRQIERSGKSYDQPKILVGYSDLTFLLAYWAKKGWPAFHGPMVGLTEVTDSISKIGLNANTSLDPLIDILKGKTRELTYNFEIISSGGSDEATIDAESGVTGGNLMLLSEMKGTSLEVDGKDRFIFMEDVDSDPTYIHRKLAGLHRSGLFDRAKGLIFGDVFLGVEYHQTLTRRVLREFVEEFGVRIPVLYSTGYGHGATNNVMPFNFPTRVHIESEKADLTFRF